MPPPYYEIRVIGVPPPEVLLDFERLSASVEPVETVLHGPLWDQAALHGPLTQVRTCPALDTGCGNATTPAGFIRAG